ncbi:tyrosine-type recombinase/integrase [Caenispirillum bisanense]|uniref:Tyr recombinase domain-containing protein n=1 Tax=Caenispirillum bisanense TaxID=414052 RepID=A0A286GPU9_9PROT|nr:integrase family protein [Caenispirillum bisanense]SOD97004.1 protein of unknown function [Caenispirillum bisanense]
MKLTDAAIRKLTAKPGQRATEYPDDSGCGLCLKVTDAGGKYWVYRYRYNRSVPKRINLGQYPLVSRAEALKTAQHLDYARKVENRDPASVVADPRKAGTVGDVLEFYMGTVKNPQTHHNFTKLLREFRAKYDSMTVANLTPHVIKNFIEDNYKHRPGSARMLVSILSAAFRKAADPVSGMELPAGYFNPTTSVTANVDFLRDHHPDGYAVSWEEHEWAAIMEGFAKELASGAADPIGLLCLQLVYMTGARPKEIQTLRWSEIQGDKIVKMQHKTVKKTGKPRHIFLSAAAKAIIDRVREEAASRGIASEWVFPSTHNRNKAGYITALFYFAKRISKHTGFDLKPYNGRSAYINVALDSGVPLHVVAGNVGHSTTRTTEKYYQRNSERMMRAGADTVGARFAELMGGGGGKTSPAT